MKSFTDFSGNVYAYAADGNFLTVTKNGENKKRVFIKPCPDFIYKLQKTQIKAQDGAAGLAAWIAACEKESDFSGIYRRIVFAWIFEKMH